MNMKKIRISLVLAALAAGCAGPTYQLKLKPYQLDAVDFRLPSGLRVLFQEDRSQPSVMVVSVVDVGAAQEPAGKEGMAHLIEHLCFRSVYGDKPKIWDRIKHLGTGFFNATTNNDRTNYFTMGPKDALHELLEIEAHRMTNPLEGVTEEDLKVEREVVRNELRLRYENDIGKLFEQTDSMLYPKGHPYGHDTIGTHESLLSITMQDLDAFVKKYYTPENFTVVVTGDFDRTQASALLSKAFPRRALVKPGTPADAKIAMIDPIVRQKAKQTEPPKPVDRGPRHIKAPLPNPVVVLAWSLPEGFYENQALMELTTRTMNNAIAGILYPGSNDEKDRNIEGLGCSLNPGRYGSTAFCFIELTEGQDPEKIASKAVDGLSELWNAENAEGISLSDGEETYFFPGQRKQFEIAKGQMQADLFRESASLLRADPISEYLHYTGRPDYFTARISEISKINALASREFAYKYLTRDRVVKLIAEPEDPNAQKTSSVAADQGSSWAGATYGASGKGSDFAKLTAADFEKLAISPDVATVKELTLPNGLKVFLKKHGTTPFVSVALYSHGGSSTANPWGFPDFSFERFEAQDPGKVAGDWFGAGFPDGQLVGVQTPSGNLAEALDLVADRTLTTKSNWNRRAFDRLVERRKSQTKTAEKRPDIWASRAMSNLLLHDHPFGRVDYDFDALAKLGASDYDAWIKKQLAPKNSALFVVGDIDLADAEKKIGAIFGKWRMSDPGERLKGFPAPPAAPARQLAFVDDPERTQVQLTIGCPITKPSPENDAARDVFLKLLGEDLWLATREKTGASYGTYPFPSASSDGQISLLYVSGAIQNDKAKPALKAILDRMAEIKAGKVDPVKLNEVKWIVAAGTRSDNQSPPQMLMTLVGTVQRDEPLTALSGYPQRLAKVGVPDLQKILEPCIGHEVITIIGPEKQLRSGFESLKIPVETVDWRKGRDAKPDVDTKASAP